jgi:hypothetical protein
VAQGLSLLSVNDAEETLTEQLKGVVSAAGSVDEVRVWLEQRPDVLDVVVHDYLVKTNPPQLEIEVRLSRLGRHQTRIVDLVCLPTGRFRLGTIHDAE